MLHTYDWERRWHPRQKASSFATDSTSNTSSFRALWEIQNYSGLTFKDIQHIPCLILLGEPGQGKSYFVRQQVDNTKYLLNESVDEVISRDLQGSNSAEYIRQILFADNTPYIKWKQGNHNLEFFIDSVDRTLTSVETVITIIANELRTVDVGRLKLRIMCRDYDWSFTLADALVPIWGKVEEITNTSLVQVYQLAPLTTIEIVHATKVRNINPSAFLDSIHKMDAMPLATLPITLNMMLNRFPEIAETKIDLYYEALKALCDVTDETNIKFSTDLDARFRTAAKIATIMVLSNKYTVKVDGDYGKNSASMLLVVDLLSDTTSKKEEKLVRETLKTSLFQGTSQRQWKHQSFAEFLTAHFLNQFDIPLGDIVEKTTINNDMFAPQIHEMLRWLSQMRSDIFQEVLKRQPTLLLSMDLSHITPGDFKRLLKALLSIEDEYVYATLINKMQHQTIRFNYPELSKMLSSYLAQKSSSKYLRLFIIDLINYFKLSGLDEIILQIVLDKTEDFTLRTHSAHCLWKTGTSEAKLQLKPYIHGLPDDPNDDLKGYALLSLWSEHITAEELFSVLTPPRQDNYFGGYSRFLNDEEIISKLNKEDLPIALDWIRKQPRQHKQAFSLVRISKAIMTLCWDNLHFPEVELAFAETAIELSKRHDNLFYQDVYNIKSKSDLDEYNQKFINEQNTRRRLVLAILPYIVKHNLEISILTGHRLPYLFIEDLDWILNQWQTTDNEQYKEIWREVMTRQLRSLAGIHSFIPQYLPDINKIYYACELDKNLRSKTESYFYTILSNEKTEQQREAHYERKANQRRYELAPLDPPPIVQLEELLIQFNEGDLSKWVNIVYILSLSSDGQRTFFPPESPDIQDLPTWDECSFEMKEQVLDVAKTYILEYPLTDTSEWYSKKEIPNSEYYGYFAFFLILKTDYLFLDTLSTNHWQRWAKIITWFPIRSTYSISGKVKHQHVEHLQRKLLYDAYKKIPNVLISYLHRLIEAHNKTYKHVFSPIWKFEHCWDELLEEALLSDLINANLTLKSQDELLIFLLRYDNSKAKQYAEEVIMKDFVSDDEKARIVTFSASLMTYAKDLNWDIIWNILQTQAELGKEIIERIASEFDRPESFSTKLDTKQLADLYIWVENRYPTHEDPEVYGVHTVTKREQIGSWRNNLISAMRSSNNTEVLSEIIRLTKLFPDIERLQFVRVDIESNSLETDWTPQSSNLILAMADKAIEKELKHSQFRVLIQDKKWSIELIFIIASLLVAICGVIATIFTPQIQSFFEQDNELISTVPSISTTEPVNSILSPTVRASVTAIVETETNTITFTPEQTQESLPRNTDVPEN